MGKIRDLTGQTFGKLVVLKQAGLDKRNRAMWRCRCECGQAPVILGGSLVADNTRSCGCLRNRVARESQLGKNNSIWAGDNVGYHQAHNWVKQNKPKPSACQMCRERPPTELSFNYGNGKWTRNIEDYEWLCTYCHKIKDVGRGARPLTKARRHRIREFFAVGATTFQELADLFKVSRSTIKCIIRRQGAYEEPKAGPELA